MSNNYFVTYNNGELWIEHVESKFIHVETLYPKIQSGKGIGEQRTDQILSPVPGIVREIYFNLSDHVDKDNTIITIESMKTYFELKIGVGGIITKLNATIGDQVAKGDLLVQVSDKSS